MRCASFVLALLALAPAALAQAAADDEAPAGIIGRCAGSADPALVGLDALEPACPGLRQALVDSGYLPFLSAAQQQVLAVDQLIELRDVLDRYREPPRAGGIEIASLDRVLRSLQPPKAERPQTLLERLQKWLRELLDRQSDSDSLLAHWLDDVSIPAAVTRALVYASIIMVICLALAAVINELRVAGVLRWRGIAAADRRSPAVAVHEPAAGHGMSEPADSAPMLLRELVGTLVRTGRLGAERSLTHRELGVRASFDAVEQRECFQRVAALAERVVYGGRPAAAGESDDVLEAGRALNSTLGGAT